MKTITALIAVLVLWAWGWGYMAGVRRYKVVSPPHTNTPVATRTQPGQFTITPGSNTITLYHYGIISPDGVQRQITTSTVHTTPVPYEARDGSGWVTFTEEWSETIELPPWH